MNNAIPQHDDDRLKKAIGYSVALHFVVLIALTVRAVFYPAEPIVLENVIRVDMIALPDKGTPKNVPPAPAEAPKPVEKKVEAPKPAPKPEPAPITKPDSPKVNLDKTKKDQEAALKRLEAMQKLEKMMKSQESAKPDKAPQPQAASAIVKGNEISKGNSLTGVQRIDHQSYLGSVDQHVKRHWNLPRWMANASFKARILVFIDERGNVVKKQMTRSSNNQEFDDRVMQAIENSSPFPPPPATLTNRLAVDGMELGFPE